MSILKLAIFSLVLPSKILLFSIHNHLTKRDYTIMVDDLCDFGITACVGIWVYTYFSWSKLSIDGTPATNDSEAYTYYSMLKNSTGEFRIIVFLAAMVVFLWGRFIMMLQLTKTFGPMLRIIIVMFADVLKFLFVWGLVLIMLSSVASLLFGELPEFANFFDVFLESFSSGLGNYDFEIFHDLRMG